VATVGLALVYATVVHAVAVWVTATDPMMSRINLRSLSVQDCYAPTARTAARRRQFEGCDPLYCPTGHCG
jgi:hypothetical protein